jgi:hypothetical protein
MAIAPPLGTSWGYGIILGLGSLFALGMVSLIPRHINLQVNNVTGPCHMDPEAL